MSSMPRAVRTSKEAFASLAKAASKIYSAEAHAMPKKEGSGCPEIIMTAQAIPANILWRSFLDDWAKTKLAITSGIIDADEPISSD